MKPFEEKASADIIGGNIEKLKTIFPEAFSEGKIDFEVLKQVLGGVVDEREEKYGLNWHGKRRARQLALTPSTGTLRPCPKDSVDWDTTKNLMIEGDNLEVLKLLQKSYPGKVKLIYIDPPYNTGNDFVYPDDFMDNIKNYQKLTGQIDAEGNKLSTNTESSGRFHTDWLNMMYPRLKLARNLLHDDGVIFISIDDSEMSNLTVLCNDIFGEECKLANIAWQNSSRNSEQIAIEHEYILVYGKNPAANGAKWNRSRETATRLLSIVDKFHTSGKPITDAEMALSQEIDTLIEEDMHRGTKQNAWLGNYRNIDEDWNIYYPVDLSGEGAGPSRRFGDKMVPAPPGRHWMSQEYIDELIAENRIAWRGDRAYRKLYIQESLDNLKSVIHLPTRNGSETLKQLLGREVFDKPKPHNLLAKLAYFTTENNDTILDFFAGSGTTGHAVMAQNAVDGGNRRYILVQLPEKLAPENKDQKVAAEFCDKLGKPRNIAELTKERLRRTAKKIQEENPLFKGDLGFRVFKLDSTNIREWDPDRNNLEQSVQLSIDHLKADRTEDDILYELLLKLGLDLAIPLEQKSIAGKTVYSIGAGTLISCLATAISAKEVEPLAHGIIAWHKALAPAGDTTIVFRDSAFADDIAKTNLTAILEQSALTNVRSI